LCRRIGELIGQMHLAAIAATETERRFARGDWRASRLLTHDLAATAAPALAEFRSSVTVLIEEIAATPPHVFNFGLIHADVNSGNCHLDGDRLWLFDFDNCEYGYFLQDLAVMLYDTLYSKWVKHVSPDQLTDFVRTLWHALLSGYREAGPALAIDPDALRRFFLLREAVIYIHYHRLFPASQLAADAYVTGMKRNVETRTHALDFESLVE
jgi:Ser/Thr protein kinase RdoA (MazF antagonist)